MSLLTIENLEVFYGVINAIKGISFEVNEGEIIALIGANGAGKTTILNTITGLVPAKSGSIKFEDKDLLKTPAHKIVSMGIAHVPEGRRIFQQLTVSRTLSWALTPERTRKRSPILWNWSMSASPVLKSAAPRSQEPFPAASSRCLQWAERLCPTLR